MSSSGPAPNLPADPQANRADRWRAVRRRRLVALAIALVLLAGLVGVLRGGGLPLPPRPGDAAEAPTDDPFAYAAGRAGAFVARATVGSAQVVFQKSPGGVMETAARVAAYRGLIDAAVRGTDIPPNLLEGIVFLESAGRAEAIAGTSVADAAGLTQILAGTGQSLLGMRIDLRASRRLTRAIAAAQSLGRSTRVAALERQRAAVDHRFDPADELAATVRYLKLAEHDLGGRADLAVVAYHAGIGNLQDVLHDYDGGSAVPYAQLYFDIAPNRHAMAWRLLSSLGDDSALYYWRVLAAEQIMHLYRSGASALAHLTALETGYPSNALVLLASASGSHLDDPASLADAYAAHRLVVLPRNAAELHLAYSPAMGSLAHRLGVSTTLYRGLRPAALTLLIEIAAWVHRLSGAVAPLTVASTVLDARYDHLLGFDDPPGTTGYTFQIERHYGSGAQAQAFQFVLDRLQALDLIAWIRGTSTIEITVAPDAAHVLSSGV